MIPDPPKIAMIPRETKMIRGKKNDPIVNYIYSAEKSRLTHSIATYRIYEYKKGLRAKDGGNISFFLFLEVFRWSS